MLLGPRISRVFSCSNEEKKGAHSSPISMGETSTWAWRASLRVFRPQEFVGHDDENDNEKKCGQIKHFFFFKNDSSSFERNCSTEKVNFANSNT